MTVASSQGAWLRGQHTPRSLHSVVEGLSTP